MSQITVTRRRAILAIGATACGLAGCGGGAVPEKVVAETQSDFNDGMIAVDDKDYETAVSRLTDAINGAGLNPDLLSAAYLERAHAYLELGKYEKAAQDLDDVEPYASDPARVHELRGELYLRQSNREKALAEYTQARRFNPKIALPQELK